MKIRTLMPIWGLVLALTLFAGCQQSPPEPVVNAPEPMAPVEVAAVPSPAAAPAIEDPVVATVNGEAVHQSDLFKIARSLGQQAARMSRQQVLEQAVAQRLIAQAAVKAGQVVAASEVDEAYQRITDQRGGKETFEAQLAEAGVTPEEVRDEIQMQMKVDKVLESKTAGKVSISDASVEAFYTDNPQFFERASARHILIKAGAQDSEEKQAEARKRIDAIAERIKAGEDFAEVAKTESEDPGSAVQGGDLGQFGRGRMVPVFEEAAFTLEAGEISDVVQSQFGYHLIQGQGQSTVPLEEVRDRIHNALEQRQRDQIIGEWVEQLREEATI